MTGLRAPSSVEQRGSKLSAVEVTPDELADVLAGGPIAAFVDLSVDEGPELVGKRHVHGGHGVIFALGKDCQRASVVPLSRGR